MIGKSFDGWSVITKRGYLGKNVAQKVPEGLAKTQSKLSKQKAAQNDRNWIESFVQVIFALQQLVDEEAGWKVPSNLLQVIQSNAIKLNNPLFCVLMQLYCNSTILQFYDFTIS